MAAAKADASPPAGSIRTPQLSSTTSAMAPTFDATTGVAHARDSSTISGTPSDREGQQHDIGGGNQRRHVFHVSEQLEDSLQTLAAY